MPHAASPAPEEEPAEPPAVADATTEIQDDGVPAAAPPSGAEEAAANPPEKNSLHDRPLTHHEAILTFSARGIFVDTSTSKLRCACNWIACRQRSYRGHLAHFQRGAHQTYEKEKLDDAERARLETAKVAYLEAHPGGATEPIAPPGRNKRKRGKDKGARAKKKKTKKRAPTAERSQEEWDRIETDPAAALSREECAWGAQLYAGLWKEGAAKLQQLREALHNETDTSARKLLKAEIREVKPRKLKWAQLRWACERGKEELLDGADLRDIATSIQLAGKEVEVRAARRLREAILAEAALEVDSLPLRSMKAMGVKDRAYLEGLAKHPTVTAGTAVQVWREANAELQILRDDLENESDEGARAEVRAEMEDFEGRNWPLARACLDFRDASGISKKAAVAENKEDGSEKESEDGAKEEGTKNPMEVDANKCPQEDDSASEDESKAKYWLERWTEANAEVRRLRKEVREETDEEVRAELMVDIAGLGKKKREYAQLRWMCVKARRDLLLSAEK